MSCLFDSMHALLKKHGIIFNNSDILRKKIVKFMRENPNYKLDDSASIKNWIKWVAEDRNQTSEQYIQQMENPSTWGGGMELALMSKMFNITIKIKHQNSIVGDFSLTENPEAIFYLYWTGGHFMPIKIDYN